MASLVIFAVILGLLITSVSVEKICRNKACVKIAKKYLSNMDTSVDPCDDFYKFACGKYESNNPIPEDALSVSEFTIRKPLALRINGNHTVGENIADFGGQKTAHLSYQNWRSRNNEEQGLDGLSYTNNQLFWIASAGVWRSNEKEESVKFGFTTDPHSPNEFRINVPMSNLEMFAKDFNCPLGSNMNPEKKCTPW